MPTTLESLFSLQGRVALVTGGTRGVGAMLARGLMIAGARVIISGRSTEAGRATVKQLSEFGACEFIAADLADPTGPQELASRIIKLAPDLNILVNNAGITDRTGFGDCTGSEFDQVLSLNVKVPFLLSQSLQPLLKCNATYQSPSHIINTGSIAALASQSSSFVYGPSKSALHHLTKVLARHLAPDNIRVNAIVPGLFPSNMTAEIVGDKAKLKQTKSHTLTGRIGEPDDLAGLIVAIVSNKYMTGNLIPIDGGLAI